MSRVQIPAKEVEIGMYIVVDPEPVEKTQQNPFYFFEDLHIRVEEIVSLPNGAFYFIYGGFDRTSVYIEPSTIIEISIKEILRRL